MSKIGRKPIDLSDATVTVEGLTVSYKGKLGQGTHELSPLLVATVEDNKLFIKPVGKEVQRRRDLYPIWGMHRALLANKIFGATKGFENKMEIVGLGYKAKPMGNKIEMSLGFSHKITLDLPEGITFETDKSGQKLSIKCADKERLGAFCSQVRALRPPEPYKGTGVKMANETILRKAGKAKS